MGLIVYDGPSLITGKHIVAILTGETGSARTSNRKTGDMVQLWIMVADVEPTQAIKTGADAAICGSCPMMGLANGKKAVGRLCYVNTGQAPLAVWRAWKRGSYKTATVESLAPALQGRVLRLGAYGDPRALPISLLRQLVGMASGHTGYTHSWALPGTVEQGYHTLVMASVQSNAERRVAQAAGWRTFRTRHAHEPMAQGEVVCPASEEAGKRRTCETCQACDGASRPGQASVTILYHGGIVVKQTIAKLAVQAQG